MNALLGSLLQGALGKYIEPEGLRSINFSFSGEIKLRNLAVRPEVRARCGGVARAAACRASCAHHCAPLHLLALGPTHPT